MPIQSFPKDPQAILDYTFDWSYWLAEGETIDSYILTVPAGVTLDSEQFTATTVTAWISGGTDGVSYTVACKIVTDNATPRTDERSIILIVSNR